MNLTRNLSLGSTDPGDSEATAGDRPRPGATVTVSVTQLESGLSYWAGFIEKAITQSLQPTDQPQKRLPIVSTLIPLKETVVVAKEHSSNQPCGYQ